jgi:ABC-type uncharacterized transport system substrate-binding protein
MRRREFITLISGAASWPVVARAQRPEQMRRIGVLTQGSINSHPTPPFRAFLNALHEAGWDEGHNLKIEWRFSEGSAEPLPRLANELVDLPVELITTAPTEPTLAAKQATSTIPIVFVQVADPVRSGIVTNLARPDANVTGMRALATDIAGKRLALIKEALPNTKLETVIRIAEGLKLPLVSQSAQYARSGGLMAYGPDLNELYRRGAEYVNRILRGAKPGDLPVQQPDKFNLILNLKTAKALGIEFPALLLARADEVIE